MHNNDGKESNDYDDIIIIEKNGKSIMHVYHAMSVLPEVERAC
jgi:hypothetical protein